MKTYILNLYTSYKRRQSAIEQFQKQSIPFELVYGIDNNTLKTTSPYRNMSFGAVGAFVSHLHVLQNASNQDDDLIFIAEDDVELGEQFINRLESSIAFLPKDWDIAFLGWDKSKGGKEIVGKKGSKWIQVKSAHGTFAYLVKRSSIPKILTQLREVNMPYDIQLTSAIEAGKINAYWRREKLVTCKDFPSEV